MNVTKKPDFHEIVSHQAETQLLPVLGEVSNDVAAREAAYIGFLKTEQSRIREAHQEGATGLEVAAWGAALVDVVINDFFRRFINDEGDAPFSLVASGGYGRGLLNPGSDVDLQFLMHRSISQKHRQMIEAKISSLLVLLYNSGLKVGHAVRTLKEMVRFANDDHPTKTALLDARCIGGSQNVCSDFESLFYNECIRGKERKYLEVRSRVIRERHRKYARTIHRQEPQVKMGCGGLRDYHNLIWLIWILDRTRDLTDLVSSGKLSSLAHSEIEEAYEFLMRVRNELHYLQKNSSNAGDIMTLRLQGLIASNLEYPGSTIIKRNENFMREYYRHTRNLYQHGTSLMQAFHLEVEDSSGNSAPFVSVLAERFYRKKEVYFEQYVARDGLVFAADGDPFELDSHEMMRFFLHTQQRGLRTSPDIRKLYKEHRYSIDDDFRSNRANRETFEQILQTRGQVSPVLRQMHRVRFLGDYLPEFGQLTDLVQHEFFHQYSADEHTLRCIDEIDRVLLSDDPKEQFFKKIFQDLDDSVAIYMALIMHDTGRAEGVRVHEDASAILAADVCKRLNYTGDRLRLIMFLVDHHLTFWRTATTKDISDPDTISDFATTVKTQANMEALYLFTYVDSRGTNEDAWNDWKASLMRQLYYSTCAYLQDSEAFSEKFQRPHSETKPRVETMLTEGYSKEIEAHYRILPERYFSFRGATSIARHVKLFREFIDQGPDGNSLLPVFGWQSRPDEGYSILEVVSWNQNGLLANLAGALASQNLNILAADFFVREDGLTLEIFRVCTTNFKPIESAREIQRLERLVRDSCTAGAQAADLDYRALIKEQAQPGILDQPARMFTVPQRVILSNDESEAFTIMALQAVDRIGLLFDVFSALRDLEINVVSARISTQAGAAIDRFWLIDTKTEAKIVAADKLALIEEKINDCLSIAEAEAVETRDQLS